MSTGNHNKNIEYLVNHCLCFCKIFFVFIMMNHVVVFLFQGKDTANSLGNYFFMNWRCISFYTFGDTCTNIIIMHYIKNISTINGFIRGLEIISQGISLFRLLKLGIATDLAMKREDLKLIAKAY